MKSVSRNIALVDTEGGSLFLETNRLATSACGAVDAQMSLYVMEIPNWRQLNLGIVRVIQHEICSE
jgi:hypothetical protein